MNSSKRAIRLLVGASLLIAATLTLRNVSTAHGGAYRGPGDSAPAGAGGGGGGGSSSPGNAPGSTNNKPTTGGAGPKAPGRSNGNTGTSAGPVGPSTSGGISVGVDETDWSRWWELNKDPYLELKSRLYSFNTGSGNNSILLGGLPANLTKNGLRPSQDQVRNLIVPALMSALQTETHNEVITGALIAIAKSGRKESDQAALEIQKSCLPFLADSNQEIAETAALALGILGHDAGADVLQELLLDSPRARRDFVKSNRVHYRTRSFAAYALSIIGERTNSPRVRKNIVATLFKTLDGNSSGTKDIRVACMVALGRTPLANAMPLQTTIPREQWKPSSCRVAEIDKLQAFLKSDREDFMVRAHAPTALVALLKGLPKSVLKPLRAEVGATLLERIHGKYKDSREVVQSCVIALGLLADTDNDPIDIRMRETLLEIDKYVADPLGRRLATIALAQVASRPGTGPGANSGRDKIEAKLTWGIKKGSTSERPWMALAIGVLHRADDDQNRTPSVELQTALLKALTETRTPSEAGAIAIAIGMTGSAAAQPILKEKLATFSVEDTRGYLVLALGLIGHPASIPGVQDIVTHSRYRPNLLRQSAVSLGLMGDKSLVPDLVDMMANSKSLSTQAATASALGFIGDSRSIEPLLKMLANREQYTDTARGFAVVSLGLVADGSDLPWNAAFANDINYQASTSTLNDSNGTGLLNIL